MPNPLIDQTADPTPLGDKIFVVPGVGRKTPLPLPGTNITIPPEGRTVTKTLAVIRLLKSGDLIVGAPTIVVPDAGIPLVATSTSDSTTSGAKASTPATPTKAPPLTTTTSKED